MLPPYRAVRINRASYFNYFSYRTLGFLAHPEEISKWRYCLIDLSLAEAMNISSEDILAVIEQNKHIAGLAPPGPIIAVASPKDLGFGLARVWEVFVEQVGWETMTFRSRTEAEAWIKERLRRKFGIVLPDASSAP
jgi:hypothetical protein